jgi:S1-C subfamily serine protease
VSEQDQGSEFARPAGEHAGFSERPQPGPDLFKPPQPSPEDAYYFGPPVAGQPFDPQPGERLSARHLVVPEVSWELAGAFAGTGSAGAGFEPVPGTRISPHQPGPGSPFWKDDAERDPWRDPESPFWLAGPPVYLDDEVVGMAEPPAESEEAAASAPVGNGGRRKFGWSALGLVVVAALIAGTIGGGAGYLLSQRAHRILTNPDTKLATSGAAVTRPPGSIADTVKRVSPAVVSIDVRTADESGSGSGVVIDGGGYILTNNHVVAFAAKPTIRVIFADKSSAVGRVVGTDPSNDIAVVKVDKTGLTVASLGNSDTLAVGDPVIAIGDPLGLRGTVTSGIVSALKRPLSLPGENGSSGAVIDAIQTDAPINPGNSGGALLDATGAVIGINTAILSLGQSSTGSQAGSIGVGFAIPVNTARKLAQQLINTGKVVHATLGVSSRAVTDGSRDGAYLVQIVPDGPAAKAGLKEGDVVTLFNSTLIDSGDALTVAVSESDPGQKATLHYVRNGSEHTATVTLGTA